MTRQLTSRAPAQNARLRAARRKFGWLATLCWLFAFLIGATEARAFYMEAGLPLYIYPRADQSDWQKAFAAGGEQVGFIIANVYNGPGSTVSSTWTAAIDNAVGNGIAVYGYVYSQYGARNGAEIDADIQRWFQLYPKVTGIFIDQTASSAAYVPYYKSRYTFTKALNPAYQVVINPGTVTDEGYMGACDINTIFESTYSSWLTKTIPSWVFNYPEDRFYAIVYGVPTQLEMEQVVQTAKSRNFGTVFVTSATSPTASLPLYFDAELAAIVGARTVVAEPAPSPEPALLELGANWVSNVTAVSATVNWSTSIPAGGTVKYWRSGSAYPKSITDPTLAGSHSVYIGGLVRKTLYYYQVIAQSQDGQTIVSAVQSFKTRHR